MILRKPEASSAFDYSSKLATVDDMSLSNLYYEQSSNASLYSYSDDGYADDALATSNEILLNKPSTLNYGYDVENSSITENDNSITTDQASNIVDEEDKYYFNTKYQRLMSLPDSVEKFMLLSDFNSDFAFGKIIISERNLPIEKKTIKPIDIGGVAGGEKFLHKGILFKYATDTLLYTDDQGVPLYMYGGSTRNDELAMKAAGNELRAIHRFAEACRKVKGINTPLMSLCDYHGYRLIAVSVIPIDATTIIYGSSNGGCIVHNSNQEINRKMMSIGQLLNLKAHLVGGATVYGPGDIEVHRGKDGNFYAIDFGRLYSPQAPSEIPEERQKDPRSVFYKHLRPEFVRSNKGSVALDFTQFSVPLCSDAFTKWQSADPNAQQHNKEVTEATKMLLNETIPQFAKELNTKSIPPTLISEYMHAAGINYRFLGKLRNAVSEISARKTLLTIMVARCIKVEIYRNLRKLSEHEKAISDTSYKRLITNIMNLTSQQSRFFGWFYTSQEAHCSEDLLNSLAENPVFASSTEVAKNMHPLKYLIAQKFGRQSLSDAEYARDLSLHRYISFGELYRLLQNMKCFHIGSEAVQDYLSYSGRLMLWETDVISVEPKVKFLSWIDFCDGFALLQKGMQLSKAYPVLIKRLFKSARTKLCTAWASHSENEEILYHFGIANFELARTLQQTMLNFALGKDEVAHILELYEMAGDCFYRAYLKSKIESEEHLSQMFLPRQKSFLGSSEGTSTDNLNIVGVNQWKLGCVMKAAESYLRLGVMTTFQYSGIHPNSTAFTTAGIMFELAHQTDKFSLESKLEEALTFEKEWLFASFLLMASINVFMKDTLRHYILNHINQNPKLHQIILSKGAKKIPFLCGQLQIQTLVEVYQGVEVTHLDISDCSSIPDDAIDLLFRSFGKTLEEVKMSGLTIRPLIAESIASNCKVITVLVLNQSVLSEEAFDHFVAKSSLFGKHNEVLKTLQELHIDAAIEIPEKKILAVVKKLPSLKKLSIKGCRVTAEGVEELQASKPSLVIDHTTGDSGISGPFATKTFADHQE